MIYFYECDDCGFYFPSAEKNLDVCPGCEVGSLTWKRCQTGSLEKPHEREVDLPQIISKKRTRANGFYDMKNRAFNPAMPKGMSPEDYEQAHEKDWDEARKRSLEVKRLRGSSKKGDEFLSHKGRIPLAQFLARQAEVNHDTDQLFDTDYWKHQGRIFDHAKDE